MIKNAVAYLMVRLHLLPPPRAAPASTYRHHHHHALRLPRPASALVRPAAASMSTTAEQAVADQKRALRTEVRRALKALSPDQRASEGDLRRACFVCFGALLRAIAGPSAATCSSICRLGTELCLCFFWLALTLTHSGVWTFSNWSE